MADEREPSLFIATGMKGVGKTYRTKQEIRSYIMDDPRTGRRGRPVLVFDVNGEYTDYQTVYYDVRETNEKKRVQYIEQLKDKRGAYRILAFKPNKRPMNHSEKLQACFDICNFFRNGMIVLEDINKYMNDTKNDDFIGLLVGLRHVGIDLMIHLQSLSPITTRFWQNVNFIRFHKQSDDVLRYKNRIPMPLMKIAQIVVNNEYRKGNERFMCYVNVPKERLIGVSKKQFIYACEQFVNSHKSELKPFLDRQDSSGGKVYSSRPEAIKAWISQYEYYLRG